MNKLLFYADFLNFKKTCHSISGTRYVAIQMGPVPKNFNTIFEYASNKNYIDIIQTTFNDGIGEQFKPNKNHKFRKELFSTEELAIMDIVAKKFKNTSTNEIIKISHKEKAWIENKDDHKEINYKYGFDLTNI